MASLKIHYNSTSLDLHQLWQRLRRCRNSEQSPDGYRRLRRGNTRQTLLVPAPENGNWIVKHWFRSHWRSFLKNNPNLHSCTTEEYMTRVAYARGVAPYAPNGYASAGLGSHREYLLVLPYLAEQPSLNILLKAEDVSVDYKQCLLYSFGKQLGQIHAANICHNDCKLDNVLVDAVESTRKFQLNLIDWGKSYEMAANDVPPRLAELSEVSKYVLGLTKDNEKKKIFLNGYAAVCSWYGSSKRTEFDEAIKKAISRQRRNSARRIWRNSVRRARRLRTGQLNGYRYYLFKETDLDQVLAAAESTADKYIAVPHEKAVEIWRAANVLKTSGEQYGGVVGLVTACRKWRRNHELLVCNRDSCAAFNDSESLISRARQICELQE